jgi:hypothetical protein
MHAAVIFPAERACALTISYVVKASLDTHGPKAADLGCSNGKPGHARSKSQTEKIVDFGEYIQCTESAEGA